MSLLKEHRKVEEQEATIAQQRKDFQATATKLEATTQLQSTVVKQEGTAAHQQKQIEALTAGLQRVSAQLELSKPTAHLVANKQ